MSSTIHRQKLFQDVADRIVEHIQSKKWVEGERLPSELELAEYFDVSRATIRSAIKSLQLSGVLYSRSGSGTYISDNAPLVLGTMELAAVMADPANISSLVQARYILEPQLAALSARNITKPQTEILLGIVGEMEQNYDRHSLMACGYRFHQAVAKFSRNQVLYGFYQSIASQLRGLRVLESLTLEIFLQGIDEHRAIAMAIGDGNDLLAKQLMRAHLKKDYAAYLERWEILE